MTVNWHQYHSDFFLNKRTLITGGCGFIGSNFVRFVLQNRSDINIINLDVLTYSGNPENLSDLENDPRYTFVHGDIKDEELVSELMHKVDGVIHFAAESHVDRSILDSKPFIESNVLGTQILWDAARKAWGDDRHRFVHVSTDEVYGDLPLDKPELLFTEQTLIQVIHLAPGGYSLTLNNETQNLDI